MGIKNSNVPYGAYNKKFSPGLVEPLSFVKDWYAGAALNIVGAAGGADQAILSKEVEAGQCLMIFDIVASLYESASLAGRIQIVDSTTAAVAGTDIELMTILLDPVEDTAIGTSITKKFSSESGAPLIIIDNIDGTVSKFLNAEMCEFVGGSLVGDAATKNYSVSWSGVLLTS